MLLDDFVFFSVSIRSDLLHHFEVVSFHGLDLIFQLFNQGALFVNVIIVLLLAQIDGVGVLLHDPLLRRSESILVSLLLLLQLIIPSCIFKHLLIILISSSLKFLVLLLLKQFQLLFIVIFHVLLRSVKLIVLVPRLQLRIRQFLLQLVNTVVLRR
jgi:hypothetical protein